MACKYTIKCTHFSLFFTLTSFIFLFSAVKSNERHMTFAKINDFPGSYTLTRVNIPNVFSVAACGSACLSDEYCVRFAYAPGQQECSLAGTPPALPDRTYWRRPGLLVYTIDNSCGRGARTVYYRTLRMCVLQVYESVENQRSWYMYTVNCQRLFGGTLIELPNISEFAYFRDAYFTFNFNRKGRSVWIGAQENKAGGEGVIRWVHDGSKVDETLWDTTEQGGTSAAGGGGGAGNQAQDPNRLASAEEETEDAAVEEEAEGEVVSKPMCAYLKPTDGGVVLRQTDCASSPDFAALCTWPV